MALTAGFYLACVWLVPAQAPFFVAMAHLDPRTETTIAATTEVCIAALPDALQLIRAGPLAVRNAQKRR